MQTDPEAQFGADVITSNQKEAIKGAIHEALQKIEGQPAKAAARPARHERKLVYLICDARDRKNTLDLRRLLLAKGFDVEIPLFEGDSATVRQANQDMLAQCSAVLVFYGDGGEAWKRSVDSELRKFLGGRQGPALPIQTCLAGPETDAKRDLLDLEEGELLNCLTGISEQAILPFLQALEGGDL